MMARIKFLEKIDADLFGEVQFHEYLGLLETPLS
jgi:hypothetical protein